MVMEVSCRGVLARVCRVCFGLGGGGEVRAGAEEVVGGGGAAGVGLVGGVGGEGGVGGGDG